MDALTEKIIRIEEALKRKYTIGDQFDPRHGEEIIKQDLLPVLDDVGIVVDDKIDIGASIKLYIDNVEIWLEDTGYSICIANEIAKYNYNNSSKGTTEKIINASRVYIKKGEEITGRRIKNAINRIIEAYKKRDENLKKAESRANKIKKCLNESCALSFRVRSNDGGLIWIQFFVKNEYSVEFEAYIPKGNKKVERIMILNNSFNDTDELIRYGTSLITLSKTIKEINRILKKI